MVTLVAVERQRQWVRVNLRCKDQAMPSSIQSAGARCQDRGTGAGLVHCAATGPVSMHRLSPANCALACHPLATARCMQARHPPPVALLPSSSQPPGPVHSVSAKHCSGFLHAFRVHAGALAARLHCLSPSCAPSCLHTRSNLYNLSSPFASGSQLGGYKQAN